MAKKRRKKTRKRIPLDIEEALLTKCRRRCAFCYAFNDESPTGVQGQIAHINNDRADNREENLAWLCLNHHDQYDGKTSQSKGLTARELKHYKRRLEEIETRRGKHGIENATIVIESDLLTPELDSDKFLESIRSLAQLNRPVVLKDKRGETSFVVSLDKDDLATLMESQDKGVLKPANVESVEPTLSLVDRPYRFYEEFPIFGTASKRDSIKIFEESDFVDSFSYSRWTIQFAVNINRNEESVAALSIATISTDNVDIGEPLVFRRDQVSNWTPDRPIELLESFLKSHGRSMRLKGEPTKLILDKDFNMLQLRGIPMRDIHHQAICRLFNVEAAEDSLLRYHDIKVGSRYRMFYLFALPHEVILGMKELAKSVSWA